MSVEKIIAVPPSDYALFQTLEGQVGKLDNPTIMEAEDAGHWYSRDLVNSEMAVRGIVRETTLARLGYKPEENFIADDENIARSLDGHSEAKALLGEPNFMTYEWQDVSSSDLGSFAAMQQRTESGPIVNIEKGFVFFTDEVQQLVEGQVVITLHSSGFEWGFIVETKEAFKVTNGNLQRVRGMITD